MNKMSHKANRLKRASKRVRRGPTVDKAHTRMRTTSGRVTGKARRMAGRTHKGPMNAL